MSLLLHLPLLTLLSPLFPQMCTARPASGIHLRNGHVGNISHKVRAVLCACMGLRVSKLHLYARRLWAMSLLPDWSFSAPAIRHADVHKSAALLLRNDRCVHHVEHAACSPAVTSAPQHTRP